MISINFGDFLLPAGKIRMKKSKPQAGLGGLHNPCAENATESWRVQDFLRSAPIESIPIRIARKGWR
jgi:hypothetical protein